MFDAYIILTRKVGRLSKLIIGLLLLMFILLIYFFTSLTYTSYYSSYASKVAIDNKYYLKLNVDPSKYEFINNNHVIEINRQAREYKIFRVDLGNNSLDVYLEVYSFFDEDFLNSYLVDIRILGEKRKIYEYLKI